jgi:hypothetical protein
MAQRAAAIFPEGIHGNEWQRQRTLMQVIFSPQRMVGFHDIFVACSEQLASQWLAQLEVAGGSLRRDIYPDLMVLFLDIIGQPALVMPVLLLIMSLVWMWLFWRYRTVVAIMAMHMVIDFLTIGHLNFPWFEPHQLC